MKVATLIEKLQKCDPNAQVRLMADLEGALDEVHELTLKQKIDDGNTIVVKNYKEVMLTDDCSNVNHYIASSEAEDYFKCIKKETK